MPKFDLPINVAWLLLILAGLIEVGWAISMKYSEAFTRLWPTVITFILMIISFGFLALAQTKVSFSVSYAIWTGIGAAGTAVVGMYFMGEPRSALKIFCVFMIVAGVVGLKLSGNEGEEKKKEQTQGSVEG
jgi:quaternary ammonium compound-resistance protein SugE